MFNRSPQISTEAQRLLENNKFKKGRISGHNNFQAFPPSYNTLANVVPDLTEIHFADYSPTREELKSLNEFMPNLTHLVIESTYVTTSEISNFLLLLSNIEQVTFVGCEINICTIDSLGSRTPNLKTTGQTLSGV